MKDYQVELKKIIEEKKHLVDQQFTNIVEYICENIVSYELLDLVLKYLEIYPQQISLIPKRLIIHLLSNTKKRELHPLVLFLVLRHNDIDYDLNLDDLPVEKWTYLMSAFYQRFPEILCDPVIVRNMKKKINTYKMLIDSPQWFNENKDIFMGLHLIEFDEDECYELFTKLKNDWSVFKITMTAVSFVDLVAAKCNKEHEFTQFLITTLFSLSHESDDIAWLSNQIVNNLKLLGPNCPIQISDWEAIIMKAVKYGLVEENPEYGFIKVLRKLVKKANIDKSIVSKSFELLAGHSQFSNIMLNRDAKQIQKEEVLRLIETLVKKEPSIMAPSHVPLFLCSYNASLSVVDQLLLRILFYYEKNSIPMSNYRPYLWGSFAISHYQVKNHLISKTLSSFPSTTEVLSYIPLKRLKETISCFPIDRILHVKNQKIIQYTTKDPSQMFDPSFFLPMISSLLATEAPLSIEKFNRSGCLSMILACLGSNDCSMRSAAYHVLTLMRSHLFCKRAENLFWDHFTYWVSLGIQDLYLKPPPQLSMIQALFLARMALAIANHEKGIETTCCKILLARPSARLQHIPELKKFLTSRSGIKDKALHSRWFFKILRDGTRSMSDWQILKNMDLFNLFLVIFKSGNQKDRCLILKIMEAAFRSHPATNGGTGPWALSLMVAISKYPNKLSTEEILLIFKCLQSLSGSSYISLSAVDFWIFLFLRYASNPDIILEGFNTLNNLVSKFKNISELFDDSNLKDILKQGMFANVISSDEGYACSSVLDYGINGIQIQEPNNYIFLPTLLKILKEKV
ncbi:Nucleolar pre-ribosomal-associated protein 1 [Aphis craccivora]|uniref:Nucleolar pre-ribosomal-associated protein 1 n=1 Tax=Aphis craccivora TaxID=307492 RepID=A0A6G0Z9U5_APHCR|nr:Nucleolar pre-ribosomal-associated protein 1 [Aphis craccivora]